MEETLAALTEALEAQRQEIRRLAGGLAHVHEALEALLRDAYVDLDELPFPERLTARRFRILSQNAEDGITAAILREAGVASARFVEIGCGTNGGNSGFLARDLGWSGLMLDASADAIAKVRLWFRADRVATVEARVTPGNVNDLLRAHGIEGEIDLLSIDIDSHDYWVLDAVEACSPRLLICEYNAAFGPTRAVTVPYDESAVHDRRTGYYGASLAAFAALGRRKGYRLVAVEPRGVNAYLLRDDVAPHIPGFAAHELFRPQLRPALQTADGLTAKGVARVENAERRADEERRLRGLELEDVG